MKRCTTNVTVVWTVLLFLVITALIVWLAFFCGEWADESRPPPGWQTPAAAGERVGAPD